MASSTIDLTLDDSQPQEGGAAAGEDDDVLSLGLGEHAAQEEGSDDDMQVTERAPAAQGGVQGPGVAAVPAQVKRAAAAAHGGAAGTAQHRRPQQEGAVIDLTVDDDVVVVLDDEAQQGGPGPPLPAGRAPAVGAKRTLPSSLAPRGQWLEEQPTGAHADAGLPHDVARFLLCIARRFAGAAAGPPGKVARGSNHWLGATGAQQPQHPQAPQRAQAPAPRPAAAPPGARRVLPPRLAGLNSSLPSLQQLSRPSTGGVAGVPGAAGAARAAPAPLGLGGQSSAARPALPPPAPPPPPPPPAVPAPQGVRRVLPSSILNSVNHVVPLGGAGACPGALMRACGAAQSAATRRAAAARDVGAQH